MSARKYFVFLLCLIFVLGMGQSAYAVRTQLYNDRGLVGDKDNGWISDASGDYIPVNDGSQDIGTSSYAVDNIYVDGIIMGGTEINSVGSLSTPWETSSGTTILTANTAGVVVTNATGDMSCTGFTVGTGDITMEAGAKIENSTNNAIRLGENSDTMDFVFTGNDVEVEVSDGGFIFDLNDATAGDSTVDFFTGNDDDDYVQVSTASDQPLINFVGCNGRITAASGTIDFVNENLTTIGAIQAETATIAGAITLKNAETISNATDDTVAIASNDAATVLRVVSGGNALNSEVVISADQDDDAADDWTLRSVAADNDFHLLNGTTLRHTISATGDHLTTGDITVEGTTPLVEIGDGGAEDARLQFDGEDTDFYIAYDDAGSPTAQQLVIGVGSTVGTDERIVVGNSATITNLTIGDGEAYDTNIVVNGVADWHIGIDDTGGVAEDLFEVGRGLVMGTTPVLQMDTADNLSKTGDIYVIGGTPTIYVGDAGDEDTGIVVAGNTNDYHILSDTTDDKLNIGVGRVAGTTSAIEVDSSAIATIPYLSLNGDLSIGTNLTVATAGTGATSSLLVLINNQQYTIEMTRV